jgi:CheY-like chemotaxis protein
MKKTVMIIDDQPAVRKLLSHYLGKFYNVIEKADASEATDFLNTGNRADIIIADVMMPVMNGIEFLQSV